ncbi:hypothetical protein [Larkinella terrae]|uniref:Uncharacterized protein n=1 Tax=Larkinella terrae TaxID=2025311 RepID=A0A7K0EIV2_9BACT|nr:hypothetical protein [Larkinella terrae]MRS61773.1 hypothetical protein [Larkinella terrae]
MGLTTKSLAELDQEPPKPGIAVVTIQFNGRTVTLEFDAQEMNMMTHSEALRVALGMKPKENDSTNQR